MQRPMEEYYQTSVERFVLLPFDLDLLPSNRFIVARRSRNFRCCQRKKFLVIFEYSVISEPGPPEKIYFTFFQTSLPPSDKMSADVRTEFIGASRSLKGRFMANFLWKSKLQLSSSAIKLIVFHCRIQETIRWLIGFKEAICRYCSKFWRIAGVAKPSSSFHRWLPWGD